MAFGRGTVESKNNKRRREKEEGLGDLKSSRDATVRQGEMLQGDCGIQTEADSFLCVWFVQWSGRSTSTRGPCILVLIQGSLESQ